MDGRVGVQGEHTYILVQLLLTCVRSSYESTHCVSSEALRLPFLASFPELYLPPSTHLTMLAYVLLHVSGLPTVLCGVGPTRVCSHSPACPHPLACPTRGLCLSSHLLSPASRLSFPLTTVTTVSAVLFGILACRSSPPPALGQGRVPQLRRPLPVIPEGQRRRGPAVQFQVPGSLRPVHPGADSRRRRRCCRCRRRTGVEHDGSGRCGRSLRVIILTCESPHSIGHSGAALRPPRYLLGTFVSEWIAAARLVISLFSNLGRCVDYLSDCVELQYRFFRSGIWRAGRTSSGQEGPVRPGLAGFELLYKQLFRTAYGSLCFIHD